MKTATDTALLLIDMQKGMAGAGLPPRNQPQAEGNMELLLNFWRENRLPVVHVCHMSRTPSSVFWPGQVGVEFQERLAPLPHELVVEKNITCAFTASGLERWLCVHGIATVVLVGVSTNFSVEASARTASQLGFKTLVVADATFAFDMQDLSGEVLSAQQVHAMSLCNLHHEYASVVGTQQLLLTLADDQG